MAGASQGYGTFDGKVSVREPSTSIMLTIHVIRHQSPPVTIYQPAFDGSDPVGALCTLYADAAGDGTHRVQMSTDHVTTGLWLGLDAAEGNLTLTADVASAAVLRFGGDPGGQGWQVQSESGFVPVGYYPTNSGPAILTTNLSDGSQQTFSQSVVTASASSIAASKTATKANLSSVVLDGAAFVGVDFTGADLSNASLVGCDLSSATLSNAVLTNSDLSAIVFGGATLDGADMTGATLAAPSWGVPASAKRIVLVGCRASGAVLGTSTSSVDMSDAQLSGGDFTDADLRGLNLAGAKADKAILVRANLAKAVLRSADLTGAVAIGATITDACLANVVAPGAVLAGADLSHSDLSQACLCAEALLFGVSSSLAVDLDADAFPSSAVIQAFSARGVTLDPEAPVSVVMQGQKWQIDDPQGPYSLILSTSDIGVFAPSTSSIPAVLRGAVCVGTKASGAKMMGVDLRGAQWYGQPATLDHADLSSASLSSGLFTATDFTQAFLSGADFSGSVLVGATFKGCDIGVGAGGRPFSLEGAQLQGCDFTQATMRSAVLVGGAASVVLGSPVFSLPLSEQKNLSRAGLATLDRAYFTPAGFPLGSSPTIAQVSVWRIDNRPRPIGQSPTSYFIRLLGDDYHVFDGQDGKHLFVLPPNDAGALQDPPPDQALIGAFAANGYDLGADSTIAPGSYHSITVSADAESPSPFSYSKFSIDVESSVLRVYGSTLLLLRDWQSLLGVAFGGTRSLQEALNGTSISPSGYPVSNLTSMSWAALITPPSIPS